MAKIIVNGLAEDEGKKIEPFPAGKYEMVVSNVEETETSENAKNPGQPMLKFTCKVATGEHADRICFHNIVLPPEECVTTEELRRRAQLKRFGNACGVDMSSSDFDTQDFLGQHFLAVIGIKKDEYGENNNIKDVLKVE